MKLPATIRTRASTAMPASDSLAKRLAARQSPCVTKLATSLPIRAVNPLNRRDHWATRAKRAKEQRERVRGFWAMGTVPTLPVKVTLVRRAPQECDYDGLVASMKHVVDGIADAYGVDDADPRFAWVYRQEKSKTWGVGIVIEAEDDDA